MATKTEEIQDAEVVEEEPRQELAIVPPQPAALFQTDDPVEVVQHASRVADALKDVVASRGLIATISGREHPQVEAWQTLGSMLGVYAVPNGDPRPLPWPDPVPAELVAEHKRGLVFGFVASFTALKNGQPVGGGEARCTRTERTWKARDDFALASMAQTRATSKALKGPLGFVMKLAGYEATPAEEMPSQPAGDPKHPLGPDHDPALRKDAAQACVKLAGGSQEGIALWKLVGADCGGYVPQAAALALVRAAATENLVPIIEAPEPQ